jgi:uncharacterized protein
VGRRPFLLDCTHDRGYIRRGWILNGLKPSVWPYWNPAGSISSMPEALFDSRAIYTVASPRFAEERWLSVGELNGRLVAVVWTQRGEAIRIITMRRARDEEKERYRALFG